MALLYLLGVFTGIGFACYTGWLFFKALQSNNWPASTAVITHSELKVTEGASSTGSGTHRHYDPIIRYKYEVKGVSYTGDKVMFTMSPFRFLRYADGAAYTNHYHVDKGVVIRYDKSNPSRSVLEEGAGAMKLAPVIFLICLAASALMLFFYLQETGQL